MRQRFNQASFAHFISWFAIQLMQGVHKFKRIEEQIGTAKLRKHKILKEARRSFMQTNMDNDAKR
tara:strand:- start:778 stop:972 length:195 start_codon:yes stop_codon:yes gene_type:complete